MQYYYYVLVCFLIFFEKCLGLELIRFKSEEDIEIIPGEWLLHIPAGFEAAKRIADAEGFQSINEVSAIDGNYCDA